MKQAQEKKDAEAVFEKLPAKYGAILPMGSSLDGRLRFEDFNSNQVRPFQMSNVPAEEKDALVNKLVKDLTAAQYKYDPSTKDSVFVASKVTYDEKGGLLSFSLQRIDATRREKGATEQLARK